MPTFSNVQKANCVIWLAETHDVQMVKTKFEQEFPKTNQPPSEPEIRKWYENFKKTGLYDEQEEKLFGQEDGPNNEPEHVSFESAKKVLDIFRKEVSGVDLHATDYEKDTGLLNFFGFRKIHKCHPYKMHLKGKPTKEDFDSRKIFAKKELDRIHANHHVHHRIWFGGEATFYTNGRVETHNIVYLAEDSDNAESKAAPPSTVPGITVWAALNNTGLLGPYIVNDQADKNSFHLFLRKFLYELKQFQRLKILLEEPIFMHDDAQLHDDIETQDLLNQEFSFYWVGPGSTHAEWPKLSPDMNPLCFFLWGHIKNKVYEKPLGNDDVTELGNRIHHAFTDIMPEMLEAAVKAYKERLKMVIEADGDFADIHEDDENEIVYAGAGVMPYYL